MYEFSAHTKDISLQKLTFSEDSYLYSTSCTSVTRFYVINLSVCRKNKLTLPINSATYYKVILLSNKKSFCILNFITVKNLFYFHNEYFIKDLYSNKTLWNNTMIIIENIVLIMNFCKYFIPLRESAKQILFGSNCFYLCFIQFPAGSRRGYLAS